MKQVQLQLGLVTAIATLVWSDQLPIRFSALELQESPHTAPNDKGGDCRSEGIVLTDMAVDQNSLSRSIAPHDSPTIDIPQTHSLMTTAPAQPNLKVTSITHTAYTYPDNTCSVKFFIRIQNAGSSSAGGFTIGAKGWGTPTIASCTGDWRAINTTTSLPASQYRTIMVYGPGYVGPRVPKGSYIQVTGYADTHCAVSESSEFDNSLVSSIHVGYP